MDRIENQSRVKIDYRHYASAEGLLKISHFALYKSFGVIAAFPPFAFLATSVMGLVEMLAAILWAKKTDSNILPNKRELFGLIGFGVIAVYMTVLPIYILSSVGTALFGFMTALSILPGALFDRLAFKDRLGLYGWLSIIFFLLGAWIIQDRPSLLDLYDLPRAMVWAYTFPLAAALNELLIRYVGIRNLKPQVTTFWVGFTQFIICAVGILILLNFVGELPLYKNFLSDIPWLTMVLLGFLVMAMHIVKQKAYSPLAGGTIVSKKVLMIAVLMIGTQLYDWIVLGSEPTLHYLLGTVVFIFAVSLSYRGIKS